MRMMMIVQVQFVAQMVLLIVLLFHHLESTGHLSQWIMELLKERVKYQVTMIQSPTLQVSYTHLRESRAKRQRGQNMIMVPLPLHGLMTTQMILLIKKPSKQRKSQLKVAIILSNKQIMDQSAFCYRAKIQMLNRILAQHSRKKIKNNKRQKK